MNFAEIVLNFQVLKLAKICDQLTDCSFTKQTITFVMYYVQCTINDQTFLLISILLNMKSISYRKTNEELTHAASIMIKTS